MKINLNNFTKTKGSDPRTPIVKEDEASEEEEEFISIIILY